MNAFRRYNRATEYMSESALVCWEQNAPESTHCLDHTEVRIEECKVQWTKSIRAPWHIDKGTSSDVNALYSHSSQVVECV